MYEYALDGTTPDCSTLEEPALGNPIHVHRIGRLISQDIVNSVRERNSILAAMEARPTRILRWENSAPAMAVSVMSC